MESEDIARTFNEIAVLLDLRGESPFKARAYANAARALENMSEPLGQVIGLNRLAEVKGIGDSLAGKILELFRTGRLRYYEELKSATPPGLLEMLQVPGLGPRKIKALHDELGIKSVGELEEACRTGRVAKLKGFGEKSASNICDGIERRRRYADKRLLWEALPTAEELLGQLRTHPEVLRCSTAGSLRRYKELIADVDLLASSKAPTVVVEDFVGLPEVSKILAKGDTKASVLLANGLQADLRVVSDAEYPFALMYFTGSKEHNVVMRQRAISRGLRLNEYGLFRSEMETRDPALLVPCKTEEDVFQQLGLHYIPPEMREDVGEFELAEKEPVPRLLEWTDLKGSLHNHSSWSDGHQNLAQIARSMMEFGLAYWAVTDHSKSSVQANGLQIERVRQQCLELKSVNEQLEREGAQFRLMTGAEVDILRDGRLDFPDELLAELDVVIASVHSGFGQNEGENTNRLIAATRNPYVHILGHLTGRLLLEREGYRVDHNAVIDACAQSGTWIELNASPNRLDMDWRFWTYAKSKGVKCVINCDAHRFEQVGFLRLGVGVARKAGLTKADVVNTLALPALLKKLREKRELFAGGTVGPFRRVIE